MQIETGKGKEGINKNRKKTKTDRKGKEEGSWKETEKGKERK